MIKQISVIILALAMAFAFTACSSEDEPKLNEPTSVLARFEKANNDRNVQALMDCYDPDFIALVKGVSDIVGGVFGLDGASGAMDSLMPYLSRVCAEQ